ncbi:hypothetical protein LC607_12015 [Nostoc sp. CHAB 5824]|nr:hypothetical protein [Nostoc sp. CHAB 5824]
MLELSSSELGSYIFLLKLSSSKLGSCTFLLELSSSELGNYIFLLELSSSELGSCTFLLELSSKKGVGVARRRHHVVFFENLPIAIAQLLTLIPVKLLILNGITM